MSKDKVSSPTANLIPQLNATLVAALGAQCYRLTLPSSPPPRILTPQVPPSSATMASSFNPTRILDHRVSSHRNRRGAFPAGKRRRLVDKPIDYPDLSNPAYQVLSTPLFASGIGSIRELLSSSPLPATSSQPPSVSIPPPSAPPLVLSDSKDAEPAGLTNPSAPPSPLAPENITSVASPVADVPMPDPLISPTAETAEGASVPDAAVSYAARAAAHRQVVAERDELDRTLRRPLVPPHTKRFLFAAAAERYKHIAKRDFIFQKTLPLDPEVPTATKYFLEHSGMAQTVVAVEQFVPEVVLEFYANLPEMEYRECGLDLVYVRGKMYEFSPALINHMFSIGDSALDPEAPVTLSTASRDDLALMMTGGTA